MTIHLTKSVLVLLLLIPIVRGQSRSPQQSVSPHELKTIREERTKRSLSLVEEIVEEMRSLKLPESRIRMEIALVDLLWSTDEKRARSLFKEAVATLSEVIAATRSDDPELLNMDHLPVQLRQEMLQVVTRHDPKLALDFLRTTRTGSIEETSAYARSVEEAQLEMGVAIELVARDPLEALRIGEASLKDGIDYNAMNLLTRLQSRDPAGGQKFLSAMLSQLRTEDFSTDDRASYVVLELLRNWIDRRGEQSRQSSEERPVDRPPQPILDDQAARELSSIIIKALLGGGGGGSGLQRFARGRLSELVQQLITLMPDIGTSHQAGALRRRLAELERINETRQPWTRYQELQERGTSAALLEAAKTAPPEMADNLLQNAVWRALAEGSEERAREIAEGATNPRRRAELTSNLDRQLLGQASQQQDLTKARTLLSRIPLAEERARLLAQWAINARLRGDRVAALELVREADALFVNRALNYSQIGAQLQIAQAYGELDPGKRAAIIETAIERLNDLTAAALVLNGFDLQQYFRSGEFIINSGNPLSGSTQEVARELGSLARDDFGQAKSLAERFQRREMRLMALLQIASGALSNEN